ncbi:DNL zinc finger-domain-containing protein [Phycomyces blakesleeanus]|uniref:DNL zinc finger-domain-containing protein n=1 Tax=Phycomyces blakesleeanus TaxID=4837 RepID=A0ABR3B1X9_PHYBL
MQRIIRSASSVKIGHRQLGLIGLSSKPRATAYFNRCCTIAPLTCHNQNRQTVLTAFSLLNRSSLHTCSSQRDENRSVMTNLGAAEDDVDPKDKIMIGFTCKVCDERSQHVMSKLSYTKGVVLIQCPKCENRHLIADNLGWFRDTKVNVEDIYRELFFVELFQRC